MLCSSYNGLVYKKAWLVLLLLIFATSPLCATTYYTRSSGANWNATISWSTVGYGGAQAAAYPVAGDTVNIANGITMFINATSACSVINIGQGTSGILQYASTGSFTLTVTGNITVNNGAEFWYNSNNTRTHTLALGGNLINNGTVDFVYDANDRVNITFDNATNSVVSGSGSWTLNDVTMNKSTSTATLDVQCSAFEAAIVSLTATEGTYIHDNSGSYSINAAAAADFTLNQNVAFEVPLGSLTFAGTANRLYLEGSLYVNGGNVYIGSTAGNNGLRYEQAGAVTPYLSISSGTMTVYGGLSYASGQTTDPFNFSMTGGTLLLNSGTNGTGREVFFINDVAGSTFQMSSGTIIIQNHTSIGGNNDADFTVCGTTGTVNSTGGTVQFGNNSTPDGTTLDFTPFAGIVQPNFKVTGAAGSAITVQTAKNSSSDFELLSLYIDVNKTFDIRTIQGSNGDSKNMTLTSTYDGTNAFYNKGTFTARTGTVTFTSSAPQSVGGTADAVFYNLTMISSSYVTLTWPESVTNTLTMTNGNMITTSTDILTCTSTATANIGSTSSFVNGPMIHTVASSSSTIKTYPIGKGTDYRPAVLTVKHSNATSVTYQAEVMNSSASLLGFLLPASLGSVSNTRYWNFSRQIALNFTSATMQLYYSTNDSVTNASNLRIANDDGLLNWLNAGGTGTANTTGNITSSTITTFKTKFALAFPPGGLPIELLNFTAKNEGAGVLCEWATASEINNNYFTVERSADGINFDSVLSMDGAGTSTAMQSYRATDTKPLDGDSYYRLRQTDYDGKSTLSNAVHVYRISASSYNIFPNPSRENVIFINKNGGDMSDVKIIVHDELGQEVETTTKLSSNNKELQLSIAPSDPKKNHAFIVSILSPGDSNRRKVLINQR